jgi:predicted phage baseplate assembly protein
VSLPVKKLDDRTFQDIVDETKKKIPQHCPEWTNHNVSDPGVALIELFAWMTELTIFRLNQVPDVFYTHMLNLMNFKMFPPKAARTDLTFWLTVPDTEHVRIPKNTLVTTAGHIGDQRVFGTLTELVLEPPSLVAVLTGAPKDRQTQGDTITEAVLPSMAWQKSDDTFVDVSKLLGDKNKPVACFPRQPMRPGDAFYLGFSESIAGQAIRLVISATDAQGRGIEPSNPPLAWEVFQGDGWIEATVHLDMTGGLNRSERIELLIPREHKPLTLTDKPLYWLRAVVRLNNPGQPTYDSSPQISSITAHCIGGTVEAEHSESIGGIDGDGIKRPVMLGTSTGMPDQHFDLDQAPILPREETEHVVTTDPAGNETRWTEVSDFIDSDDASLHYRWDSTSGRISFGPLIRYDSNIAVQRGAVPPKGHRLWVSGYRVGGGASGNVGPRTLTALRNTLANIARVENRDAAQGGVDGETIANAKERGPQTLRAGNRAVTAEDYERLIPSFDPQVARVKCLRPEPFIPTDPLVNGYNGRSNAWSHPAAPSSESSSSAVEVLLVPRVTKSPAELAIDDFALPDGMFNTVSTGLDERRVLGTRIRVGTPFYQGVSVVALLKARPGRAAQRSGDAGSAEVSVSDIKAPVRDRAIDALYRFINPGISEWNQAALRFELAIGGSRGQGWEFEEDLDAGRIIQLLEAVDGVAQVEDVLLFDYDLRTLERLGEGKKQIRLQRNTLFMSGAHKVVVR